MFLLDFLASALAAARSFFGSEGDRSYRPNYIRGAKGPAVCAPALSATRSEAQEQLNGNAMSSSGVNRKSPCLRDLLRGIIEFLHPIPVFQDFAGLGAVGRTDDAVLLHQIDEARGAPIANPQAALQR